MIVCYRAAQPSGDLSLPTIPRVLCATKQEVLAAAERQQQQQPAAGGFSGLVFEVEKQAIKRIIIANI